MRIDEALNILGVNGDYNPESIKASYRKACSIYHPDRNPAGLEMMKMVNQAYDTLKEQTGVQDSISSYGEDVFNALSAIINLQGLVIEVCGSWVWVSGNTKEFKANLKEAGFKWAKKKVMWFYRPETSKSFSRGKFTIDEIRRIHGSQSVAGQSYRAIA